MLHGLSSSSDLRRNGRSAQKLNDDCSCGRRLACEQATHLPHCVRKTGSLENPQRHPNRFGDSAVDAQKAYEKMTSRPSARPARAKACEVQCGGKVCQKLMPRTEDCAGAKRVPAVRAYRVHASARTPSTRLHTSMQTSFANGRPYLVWPGAYRLRLRALLPLREASHFGGGCCRSPVRDLPRTARHSSVRWDDHEGCAPVG